MTEKGLKITETIEAEVPKEITEIKRLLELYDKLGTLDDADEINKVLEKTNIEDLAKILGQADKKRDLLKKLERYEEQMKKPDKNAIETKEMEKLDDELFPKKQISVKLYPETHKKLKMLATSQGTTLEKTANSIVENKIYSCDIVKFVENGLLDFSILGEDGDSLWYNVDEMSRKGYDEIIDLLEEENIQLNPRKRINVKVYAVTHQRLRVIAAVQDRSLDTLVSSIIENEIGEINAMGVYHELEAEHSETIRKLRVRKRNEKIEEICEGLPEELVEQLKENNDW